MTDRIPPKVPPSALAALLGSYPTPDNGVSPLLRALMEADAQAKTNRSLLNSLSSPHPTVGSIFGLPAPAAVDNALAAKSPSGLFGSAGHTAKVAAPTVRNVFYSFHYRDVLRVNHVRNSNKIRPTDKGRQLTPNDRSLWEKVKRTNPSALKTLINRGLAGTSVTCVLTGAETSAREWVRYEIARSLSRGNGLLTVHIDGCKCPNEGYGVRGYNPLAVMALGWDRRIYEYRNGGWHRYDKIAEGLAQWPKWLPKPSAGRVMPLSEGTPVYDWIADDGFNNLIRWTDAAAVAAGR